MSYSRTVKNVKLNNSWSIDCVTTEKSGNTTYEVNAILESVDWKEEVESHKNLSTKEEANTIYKNMVLKYKNSSL